MAETFRGIFVALVTPLTDGDEVDYDTLASFVDSLIEEGGIHGIIPLGSTGEYYALSDGERTSVLKTVVDTVGGRVPVLAGTNAGGTAAVIRYSQEAQRIGADGILLAPPYYSLPTRPELLDHFKTVDGAIDTPIMLYNYPARTGVDIVPDLVEELSELEHIEYIKESSGDITRVSEIIRRCGDRITVFCGSDTIALESFLLGAAGWVGGVANVIPKEHVTLYRMAVENGDYAAAREFYYTILPLLALMEGEGKYIQFVKAGCAVTGRPVGGPRKPLLPATGSEIARLRALLAL